LINYESNFSKALFYAEALHEKYPNNPIYKIKYIECLLLNKEFEKAHMINQSLKNEKRNVIAISYHCFEGYLQQHYHKNFPLATGFYAKTLKFPKEERYTKEYRSLANLGLAQIMQSQNENDKAKAFYKETQKNTDYIWIKKIILTELRNLKN
jgi:hypothetical protein